MQRRTIYAAYLTVATVILLGTLALQLSALGDGGCDANGTCGADTLRGAQFMAALLELLPGATLAVAIARRRRRLAQAAGAATAFSSVLWLALWLLASGA
jgi:hypothetical protein